MEVDQEEDREENEDEDDESVSDKSEWSFGEYIRRKEIRDAKKAERERIEEERKEREEDREAEAQRLIREENRRQEEMDRQEREAREERKRNRERKKKEAEERQKKKDEEKQDADDMFSKQFAETRRRREAKAKARAEKEKKDREKREQAAREKALLEKKEADGVMQEKDGAARSGAASSNSGGGSGTMSLPALFADTNDPEKDDQRVSGKENDMGDYRKKMFEKWSMEKRAEGKRSPPGQDGKDAGGVASNPKTKTENGKGEDRTIIDLLPSKMRSEIHKQFPDGVLGLPMNCSMHDARKLCTLTIKEARELTEDLRVTLGEPIQKGPAPGPESLMRRMAGITQRLVEAYEEGKIPGVHTPGDKPGSKRALKVHPSLTGDYSGRRGAVSSAMGSGGAADGSSGGPKILGDVDGQGGGGFLDELNKAHPGSRDAKKA